MEKTQFARLEGKDTSSKSKTLWRRKGHPDGTQCAIQEKTPRPGPRLGGKTDIQTPQKHNLLDKKGQAGGVKDTTWGRKGHRDVQESRQVCPWKAAQNPKLRQLTFSKQSCSRNPLANKIRRFERKCALTQIPFLEYGL